MEVVKYSFIHQQAFTSMFVDHTYTFNKRILYDYGLIEFCVISTRQTPLSSIQSSYEWLQGIRLLNVYVLYLIINQSPACLFLVTNG
jgi:hypothetical protein